MISIKTICSLVDVKKIPTETEIKTFINKYKLQRVCNPLNENKFSLFTLRSMYNLSNYKMACICLNETKYINKYASMLGISISKVTRIINSAWSSYPKTIKDDFEIYTLLRNELKSNKETVNDFSASRKYHIAKKTTNAVSGFKMFNNQRDPIKYLDIGANDGHITHSTMKELSKKFKKKVVAYGIDIKKFDSDYKNVNFQVYDGISIPFENNSIDIITCRMVLHHINNPLNTINEIYRVLKPGGKIIITEHNVNTYNYLKIMHIDILHDLYDYVLGNESWDNDLSSINQIHDKEKWIDLFKKTNMKLIYENNWSNPQYNIWDKYILTFQK